MLNLLTDPVVFLQKIKEKHNRTEQKREVFNEIAGEIRVKEKELKEFQEKLKSTNATLVEQKKVLTLLENEADQLSWKISGWKEIINEKSSLLEREKNDNLKIHKQFVSERIKYCDILSHKLKTVGYLSRNDIMCRSPSNKFNKRNEFQNTISQLKQELAELDETINQREIHKHNLMMQNEADERDLEKYRKILHGRQAQLKKITYEIKLRKLERNLTGDQSRPFDNVFSTANNNTRDERIMPPQFSSPSYFQLSDDHYN